ncbi:MAG: ABC transporter permease [Alloprevotella sp.]|nr:ABC transporter permease [Alloprevotella sp.]
MQKTLLIIQREFLNRVKKKSFIILTVLMPFIMAALVFVPIWLSMIEDDEQKAVAISDTTGRYIGQFKTDAAYRFVPVSDPDNPAYYADTTQYEAVIRITADLAEQPRGVAIISHKEVSAGLLSYTESVLNEQVRRDKLQRTGIDGLEKIMADLEQEITVPTVKRNAEGDTNSSNTGIAMAAGFLFTFLIYMFVMSYGGMVMQSVMEEKTNRIVELMVSSVKPFQLMMGKIIGISLVGFLQLAIWGVMLAGILFGASVLFGADLGSAGQTGMALQGGMGAEAAAMAVQGGQNEILTAILGLPFGEMGLLFVLYFVGGYLLYASFFAAVGASVNEQEDSSQFMMPVVLIMVFGLYAAMGSVQNTNGPLAFWASMFPLTSPIVMMVRVPFSVPLWEELLSLVLLYATALGSVWFSARIYRVGVLMYGKKPTLKEWFKWIRYR